MDRTEPDTVGQEDRKENVTECNTNVSWLIRVKPKRLSFLNLHYLTVHVPASW